MSWHACAIDHILTYISICYYKYFLADVGWQYDAAAGDLRSIRTPGSAYVRGRFQRGHRDLMCDDLRRYVYSWAQSGVHSETTDTHHGSTYRCSLFAINHSYLMTDVGPITDTANSMRYKRNVKESSPKNQVETNSGRVTIQHQQLFHAVCSPIHCQNSFTFIRECARVCARMRARVQTHTHTRICFAHLGLASRHYGELSFSNRKSTSETYVALKATEPEPDDLSPYFNWE